MEIIQSLVQRDDIRADAREAFQKAYPDAPDCMIDVAIFHIYIDGIGATLDWLVEIEKFLREPDNEIDYSASLHLLYHIYNWHQLLALLPEGYPKMIELIEKIKAAINDDDIEAALDSAEELEDNFKGHRNFPNFS
ncbi:hypothetical protein [Roseofilum casamattae]|uniref:Uncharacterized protein n=1 Tax=Roseofilum casamattae BLCC-M143 TaxID=3022442 RepID=A0ABT7BUZ0_9CYAN|nr:hypothetical protein [Roseofilum casamattae]MDJ1182915.1 hypothetical protein [Roseofilum casamattae BLCC-M143]